MACCVCGSSEVRYARKGYVVCNIEQHTLCGRVAKSPAFQTFMAAANNDTDPIELTDMPFEILYEIFAHLQDEPEQLRQLAMTNSRLHALLAPLYLGNVLNPVMMQELASVDIETIRTIVKGVYRVAARDAASLVSVQNVVREEFLRIKINVANIWSVPMAATNMIVTFMQNGHLGLMQYTFQKAVQQQRRPPDLAAARRTVLYNVARWPPGPKGTIYETPWAHTWTHIHRWIIKSDWWTIMYDIGDRDVITSLSYYALWAAVRDNALDIIDLTVKPIIVQELERFQWRTLVGGMAALDRDQMFTAMMNKAWGIARSVSDLTRDIIERSIHTAKEAGSRAYLQAVVDWAQQRDETNDIAEQAKLALSELV